MATLATDSTPTDCIHAMLTASLDIAGRRVHVEWADLGVDTASVWDSQTRTLQIDPTCTVSDVSRVLREFVELCNGHSDGTWEHVRPQLRLVETAGRCAR